MAKKQRVSREERLWTRYYRAFVVAGGTVESNLSRNHGRKDEYREMAAEPAARAADALLAVHKRRWPESFPADPSSDDESQE